MSNENRIEYPIQTMRDGNKITKICVEDYHRVINRIADALDRTLEKWDKFLEEDSENYVQNNEGDWGKGCLVVGKGTSQPNILLDTFNEEIGNNIAFMKAKLNANMKKRNILLRLWDTFIITVDAIDDEIAKIDANIAMDLANLRYHNPNYLDYLDEFGYEIQEETTEPGSED